MELTNAKALVAKIKSDPETAKIFADIKNAADFEAEAKKFGYDALLKNSLPRRRRPRKAPRERWAMKSLARPPVVFRWSAWTMPSRQSRLPADRNTAKRACRL